MRSYKMNIISAQYCCYGTQAEPSSIRVDCGDGVVMSVPINESNADYAEIMRQVEAGELTIQDADS